MCSVFTIHRRFRSRPRHRRNTTGKTIDSAGFPGQGQTTIRVQFRPSFLVFFRNARNSCFLPSQFLSEIAERPRLCAWHGLFLRHWLLLTRLLYEAYTLHRHFQGKLRYNLLSAPADLKEVLSIFVFCPYTKSGDGKGRGWARGFSSSSIFSLNLKSSRSLPRRQGV